MNEEKPFEAVRYPERGRGYRKLAKELGLKDKKTLREWVAKVLRGESLEDERGKATNVYKGSHMLIFLR